MDVGTYRSANDRTRKLYSQAVFDRLLVRNGEIARCASSRPSSTTRSLVRT
jgi:hypothetical protein